MRIAAVFRGQEYVATVSVQEDGWMDWAFPPAWRDYWGERDHRRLIEEALKHMPDEPVITYWGFTIRQRVAEP